MTIISISHKTQEIADLWYFQHGPCCAGCDWWNNHNSIVGECLRSAPVSAAERIAMIGCDGTSYPMGQIGAGHVFTFRGHHCGEFKDEFDWSTLPASYLKRIGYKGTTT